MTAKKNKRTPKPTFPNKPIGPGNPPAIVNNTQTMLRINLIADMLLQGARTTQINAMLSETQSWHPDNKGPADPTDPRVTMRTIERYIHEAKASIVKTASNKREYLVSKSLLQMDELYNRAFNLQDYKTCLSVIKERNELMGLKRIEAHITKTTTTVDLSKHTAAELKDLYKTMRGDQEDTIDIPFEEMPQPANLAGRPEGQ